MNPQKEIEILRDASLVQAMAIEIMNEWLRGEGGEDWFYSWCEAIELGANRAERMTTAEKLAYSQSRKDLFKEWLDERRTEYTTEKKEVS